MEINTQEYLSLLIKTNPACETSAKIQEYLALLCQANPACETSAVLSE